MNGPKLLITGATGRIGAHLIPVLPERGVPARALSRDPARGEELPGVAWVEGDLADPSRLGGAFTGIARPPRTFHDFARDHAKNVTRQPGRHL